MRSTPSPLLAPPLPDVFNTPFFLSKPPTGTISIENHLGTQRTYQFPTLFTQTQAAIVLTTVDARSATRRRPSRRTPCRSSRRRSLPCRCSRSRSATRSLPDILNQHGLFPVRTSSARCLAVVAVYRYGAISDGMKGYNEMMVGIVLSRSNVPLAPALLRRRSGFGAFIVDLPVDSEENCRRGQAIWGLPKTLKTFNYRDEPGLRVTTVTDDHGDTCLQLRLPVAGKRTLVADDSYAYSQLDGRLLRTVGTFEGAAWQYSRLDSAARRVEIDFGKKGVYGSLRDLDFDARPLLVRIFDNLNSVLQLPESLTKQPRV